MPKTWIKTFTGLRIDPLEPAEDAICIEDIAHALSNLCRFNGQVPVFYSVGQHSCLVAQALEEYGLHAQLAGLLHDASEAYLGDMVTPLKHRMPAYLHAEAHLQHMISRKFGVDVINPRLVERADLQLLKAEVRDLRDLKTCPEDWAFLEEVQAFPHKIEPWKPFEAEERFLSFYESLINNQPYHI